MPQDEDGNTPLITAILHGHAAPVELLLAVGADIGIARLDGMTAIHIAQLAGHAQGHLRTDHARPGGTLKRKPANRGRRFLRRMA
jgi:hypothetical protein